MWLIATLMTFFIARKVAKKIKHPLTNPLLLSLLILLPLLHFSGDSYANYFEQNQPLHFLLNFAVIALAYPLYLHLHIIKQAWKIIIVSCLLSSVSSAFLGASIAFILSENCQIAASVLPKSISTPFALNTSLQINGIPSVSAALVVIAGLFGALFSYPILNFLKIQSPLARGLSIGAISHAIGTAKANEENSKEGAFSSLAMVICGIFTSILTPLIFTCMKSISS